MTAAEGMNPHDTPVSAAARFGVEVAAWVAGPWAAAELAGSAWVAIPVAIALVALPAVFNVPGDKKVDGVAVAGWVRLTIEMLLLAAAVTGSWVVWPEWLAILVTAAGAAMVVTGRARYRWMLAQPDEDTVRP